MKFTARSIEELVWSGRLNDFTRGRDRARIDSLFNGAPPFPPDEAEANGIAVNVNDLSATRLAHEARMQLFQGFNKPGNFFTARTDMGTPDRRTERGITVTKGIMRCMKPSDDYYEVLQSKLALLVLHGKGPGMWQNGDDWCPKALGLSDVFIPGRTYRSFSNLLFFAIWRSYTAYELKQIIARAERNPERNPGWNLPVARRAVKWADEETAKMTSGGNWSEYWAPEKAQERQKEDSGVYASDRVRTIDCWDFYYLDDAKRHEGWRRRIIFDAEDGQGGWFARGSKTMPGKNLIGSRGDFLYNSGDRVVADKLSQIIHFQFGDLSAVAPFKYHSIRGLGFLLFGACHLLARMRCSKAEATLENLMMYLRVASQDDVERALSIELGNRRVLDESVQFIPPDQRWQPNPQLTELGLQEIKQVVSENSASYINQRNLSQDGVEKTKFQVMAEVTAVQTLVSATLQQAYRYQASEYREVFRRFMQKNSENMDVRMFRTYCLSRGVPEKMLTAEAWDIEPERVVGGGNKTLEMAIAQQLMEWRSAYAPESQQEILRIATSAIIEDQSLVNRLVPREKTISTSTQTAMWAFGALMAGGVVKFTPDQNEMEVAQTLLVELKLAVDQTLKAGGMASEDRVRGMQQVVKTVADLIGSLAEDKTQAETTKQMAQLAGKLANEIKGFAQRLAQAKKAQMGAEGDDKAAELKAKLTATLLTAKAKAENTRESHAQRTAQRGAQFELEQQQKATEHAETLAERQREHTLDLQETADRHALDISAAERKAEIDVRRSEAKAAAPNSNDES